MESLILCPEAPYPLHGGGPMRTASVLGWLANQGPVDLLVFREPAAPDPAGALPPGLVRRTTVVELPYHSRSPVARLVRNADRWRRGVPPLIDRFSRFGPTLASFLQGRAYDLAVLEHFWVAPYAALISAFARRTVLDLHNIESEWHESVAATSPFPASRLMRGFAARCRRLEREWLGRFSLVLAPSEPDRLRVESICPAARSVVYPNSIPWIPEPPVAQARAIVFSGNLEYPPNQAAVRFFEGRVWPEVAARRPDWEWWIAGKRSETIAAGIRGPRIRFVPLGEFAVRKLASASIAVVPVFAGSGTRVKIIEAWAARLPVVSSTLGAEGLPLIHGQNGWIADSPEDFVSALVKLIEQPELREMLAANGRRTYERSLNWPAAWPVLDRHLTAHPPPGPAE